MLFALKMKFHSLNVWKSYHPDIVSVAVSQQFFGWIFGLGKAVRIAGPESVKEKMKKTLEDITARYEE